jgi:phosphoribosyl 1,2-cyclic phosphodiesterase
MAKPNFTVKFWGARGSIPVSGADFSRYGGDSSCVEMRCGDHLLMFDAGSGLKRAGIEIEQEGLKRLDMFFSHCHWDHIFGIPFFMPFYRGSMKIRIWSGHLAGVMTTHDMISGIMKAPYFPIAPEIFIADVDYKDFKPGDVLKPYDGITLRTGSLNHPNGAVGYRVEFAGRCACYITDTEHVPGKPDQNVLKLIDHADLVIYDAAFAEKEMQRYRGFGHSSWEEGIRLCRAAHAKKLAIFHHSPLRTDDELDQIGKEAEAVFAGAFVARQGQVIEL